ncbi:MAG: hypothetical protein ACREB9_00750 [Thermoplasmata archaeon]
MGALEDRLNPPRLGQADPEVRVEKHRAGERCRHWVRGPNGGVAYERFPNSCLLCYGSGVLNVDVNLRFHRKKGVQHVYYPHELPDVAYMPSGARKPYEAPARGRQVA